MNVRLVSARTSLRPFLVGLVLAAACSKSGDSSPTGTSRAALDLSAREVSRFEMPGLSNDPKAMAPVEQGALIAWEIEGEAAFPGDKVVRSQGETDVVICRVSASGAVEAVHSIGSSGAETVVALIPGEPPALIVRGTAPLTLAGLQLAPPPPADELDTPTWAALVTLDAAGAPASAMALDAAGEDWRALRVGQDWIVATSYEENDAERAVIQMRKGETAVWSRELAGVKVNQLAALDGAIVALTRAKRLGIERLDARTGDPIAAHSLERLGGDLGALVGVVRSGDAEVVYGYSGREAIEVKGDVLSHSIEPLTLVLRGKADPRRAQLLDATGSVDAVGTMFGQPAALVEVLHHNVMYGGPGVEHRGIYVVLGGHEGKPSLVPLVQYRHANDDWENQPAEMVTGKEQLAIASSLLAGDRVWIAGMTGGPADGRVIVVQHQLEPRARN